MHQSLTLSYIRRRHSFIWSLVYKDLKSKYAHSMLGLGWMILEPLLLVASLSVVFTVIGRSGLNAGEVPFPIFFFSGILPWNFFRHAFADGTRAFLNEASIIKKYNFPREVVALKNIALYLVELIISGISLPVMLIAHGYYPTIQWLWVIPLLMLLSATCFGVVLLFGSLNVFVRDVEKINTACAAILFWVTPIIFRLQDDIYSRLVLYLNPVAGIIESLRTVLLDGTAPHLQHLIWPILWAIALLSGGLYVFRRLERGFADVI